ncbi:MAG: glycosyltransferase family 4 protein, partial [Ignavibacteriales bacterium]|nr:glycosyltransferase family 4 protein [Ignavibacteriales bacterium]
AMLSLLPALEQVDRQNTYVVVVSRTQASLFAAIPKSFHMHFVGINPRNVLLRILYEQLVLPFVLLQLKVDWLYSVGSMTSLLAGCKILLLIENANPYSLLKIQWAPSEKMRNVVLRFLGRLSAKRANKIRFLSENSREIIAQMLKIPMEKTSVIYHGAILSRGEMREEKIDLPQKYILSVSNIGPHKNIHTLIDAFARLLKIYQYEGSLIIVGAPISTSYFRSLESQIQSLALTGRVHFQGWVSPQQLPWMFKNAEVFIFPSIEETFGMPVVEAMEYGVPVVVPTKKDNNYFIPYNELCSDAVCYFEPLDSNDLCEQLHNVLSDDKFRFSLIKAGKERSKMFRWEDTAAKIVKIFQEDDAEKTL